MHKRTSKWTNGLIRTFCAAFSAAFLLTACPGTDNNSPQDDPNKPLIVACDISCAPYVYQDMDTGMIAGTDVDMVKALANRMGRKVRFAAVPFSQIIGMVADGQADLGISSIAVTEERKGKVLFTDAYESASCSIVAPQNAAVASASDLTSLRVAIKEGTTFAAYAKNHVKEQNLFEYPTYDQALQALVERKADAVLMNTKRAELFVLANPKYKRVASNIASEDFAIAVNPKKASLKDNINKAFAELRTSKFMEKNMARYKSPSFLKQIEQPEKILVACMGTQYPPFVFASSGSIVGVDMEIAKNLARKLGAKLVIKQVNPGSIVDMVASGKADIGLSGMSATVERKSRVLFSEPYYDSKKAIVVRSGNFATFDQLADVALGIQTGSACEAFLNTLPVKPKNLFRFSTTTEMIDALRKGTIQAFVDDGISADITVQRYLGELEISDEINDVESYVVLINPEKNEIKSAADQVIRNMNLDGTLPGSFRKFTQIYVDSNSHNIYY